MTTRSDRGEIAWQRLSPRMLLVHPVYELLRELPFLIGAIVLGTTTGNQSWTAAVLAYTVVIGVARWVTTSYRIDADPQSGQLQLRTGLLQRKVLSLPLSRIRSVQSDARLLHRVMGLAVVRVSTGQEAKGESGSGAFELNAVAVGEVPRLRAILLTDAGQQVAGDRRVGFEQLVIRLGQSVVGHPALGRLQHQRHERPLHRQR